MGDKKLWSFNWLSGGYNQVYAETIEDALGEIEKQFGTTGPCCVHTVNLDTLKEVKDVKAFWDNYPLFD